MRRGDVVTVVLRGELGKPRPAVILQSDRFAVLSSVVVAPLTSTLLDAPVLRVDVLPSERNGLTQRSQVMVDKVQTPPRGRIGAVIGRLDDAAMQDIGRALALLLEMPIVAPAGPAAFRRKRAGGA